MSSLKPGQKAPNLILNDANGNPVRILDHLARGPIVVFFYPKDDTFGCTREACAFRDHFADFEGMSATIFGISSDSMESHQAFAKRHNLPFYLLSDPDSIGAQAFGVGTQLMGLFRERVSFVIDANGMIQMVFSSPFRFQAHVEKALEVLQALKKNYLINFPENAWPPTLSS